MNRSDERDTPPSFVGPPEGRELELMLEGKKHLSSFFLEVGIEREIFPERDFDRHVAKGLFVKDVRVEHYVSADGKDICARSILYATAGEAWRIPAMRMIRDIYRSMGPGWRPDLERAIGSLLGYDRSDVELFVERLVRRHGYVHDPCLSRASTLSPP